MLLVDEASSVNPGDFLQIKYEFYFSFAFYCFDIDGRQVSLFHRPRRPLGRVDV